MAVAFVSTMGEALRVALAVGAFVWRWFSAVRRPEPDREIDGRSFYIQLWRRRATGFRIGLEYPTASAFELHADSTADARLKTHHLERQEQTGDEAFDREVHVYAEGSDAVACLRNHADARESVRAAFAKGFHAVSADGRILWAAKRAGSAASQTDEQMLSKLVSAFAPLERTAPSRWTFARLKTTFVDAVVGAIAGSAIGVAIEIFYDPQAVHVNAYELILAALPILLAAGLSVVGLAVALLRGSPGIRRILIDRAGMIALSLPVVSLQMASDINRQLDRSVPVVVTRGITGRVSRGRYGTRHYIVLSPATSGDRMSGPPSEIRVGLSLYDRARPGGVMLLTIGKGRLGIPWYRQIAVRPAVN